MKFNFLARLRSPKPAITARPNKGQDIAENRLLPTLMEDLEKAVGPMKLQRITLPVASGLESVIYTAHQGKATAFLKVIEELDFSVSKLPNIGILAGNRVDLPRNKTIVTYSAITGLVVISSSLIRNHSVVDV